MYMLFSVAFFVTVIFIYPVSVMRVYMLFTAAFFITVIYIYPGSVIRRLRIFCDLLMLF